MSERVFVFTFVIHTTQDVVLLNPSTNRCSDNNVVVIPALALANSSSLL